MLSLPETPDRPGEPLTYIIATQTLNPTKVAVIHDSLISRARCDSVLKRKTPSNLANKRVISYLLHIFWQIGSLRNVEVGHKHVFIKAF